MLTKTKPVYANLKTFGCLCYVSTSPKHRHKFQERAKACVFLGYPYGYKGYKLLDLESNATFVSRNVFFYENLFPFKTTSADAERNDFFPRIYEGNDAACTPSTSCDPLPVLPQQRQQRISKPPSYLQDYECSTVTSSTHHPLSAVLSYAALSDPYFIFINAVNQIHEPHTYNQAQAVPEWCDAMKSELTALEDNSTWKICSLPFGKKPVGCKWVYKVKLHADGSLERYKARLVAKGYTQKEGLDYVDTFSPVAKLATVKLLIAVAAAKGWSLTQLDISNAFLNGELKEEIYMTLPPGYSPKQGEHLPENPVCRLHKSLYGLKQASSQWFLRFSECLQQLGFKKSSGDHTLFLKHAGDVYVAVLVYVDDIIIASSSPEATSLLTSALQCSFKLRDLGELRYFLGLEIARNSTGISLCQRKYTLELLKDTGLLGCKAVSVPMEPNSKLSKDEGTLLEDAELYRRLVGKLMYLTFTRPDITYAVHKLCQFTSAPRAPHLQAAFHVIHYLKGTVGQGLFYSSTSDLKLSGYADADWASCTDSRRSVSGFCMFVGSSLVSWKSNKQATVSRSSAKAEYRSMSAAVREMIWLRHLLSDLWCPQPDASPLFCDNTAAIHIANNPVYHERTKHIEIDCHIVREKVDAGLIKTLHVRTADQLADLFTKPLFPSIFKSLLSKMAVINIFSPS